MKNLSIKLSPHFQNCPNYHLKFVLIFHKANKTLVSLNFYNITNFFLKFLEHVGALGPLSHPFLSSFFLSRLSSLLQKLGYIKADRKTCLCYKHPLDGRYGDRTKKLVFICPLS